jgi:Rho family protein
MMEYLYTDHCPIEETDSVSLLMLANQYVLRRLMSLCELYITKAVDKACAKSIADADINIIDLLLVSQLHNANQLSGWCLHFISSNYLVFEQKEEFAKLNPDNRDYVEEHR